MSRITNVEYRSVSIYLNVLWDIILQIIKKLIIVNTIQKNIVLRMSSGHPTP